MIELTENAFRVYQLAKKIACPVQTPKGQQNFAVGLPSEALYRFSISDLTIRRAIAELEKAKLLRRVSGKRIAREIISTVKHSFATRHQAVHEVEMIPDAEIEIVSEVRAKGKKQSKVPFSPVDIVQVAASHLNNRPQAKKIVSAVIAILEKNSPPSAEDSTQLITLRGQLAHLAIKESDSKAKIALQAVIKALRELLKTKSPAAGK